MKKILLSAALLVSVGLAPLLSTSAEAAMRHHRHHRWHHHHMHHHHMHHHHRMHRM